MIQPTCKSLEHWRTERGRELAGQTAAEFGSQHVADEYGSPFDGFQRDITGKPIADDHIGPIREDLVPLDEAYIVQ